MRCDHRYQLVHVIKCEDQQPTTSQEHDHVTDLRDHVTNYFEQ